MKLGNGYSIISAKGRGRLACCALALMSQTQRHSSPNHQGESHIFYLSCIQLLSKALLSSLNIGFSTRRPPSLLRIMRLTTVSVLFAAVAVGVSGLAPQRQVLVTYPKDTPESTIDNAKESIRAAVGTMRNTERSSLTRL